MQITTKFIGNNQIIDSKVRLTNNGPLRARNAANSADVNIVKINTSDQIDFGNQPLTNVTNPTNAQDVATKSYVDSHSSASSPGDISETSFTAADNQSSSANVTGFAFANGTVRAFDALVSIVRNTTFTSYKLVGIQRGSDWQLIQSFVGDTTGITFSITTAGQIQYTSTNTGSTATIKFRAITTSV